MLEQAQALLEEGEELETLLASLADSDWSRTTPFKSWTVNDVIMHLHSGDWMAVQSLESEERFWRFGLNERRRERRGSIRPPRVLVPAQMQGTELFEAWRAYFKRMCELLGNASPELRLKWFGPDMSARMFTTARQMETWAHGQDIYDLLRQPREYSDRLKNIAFIGVRTYGWTFANRGLEVPGPAPYVRLEAPSGAIWAWNEQSESNCVEGSAVEFCHVVTQGRNIADVHLKVVGEPAQKWMAIAQCFAGPPEDPPAPGTRGWQ